MQQYWNQGWKVAEEIVLVPVDGPREVQQQRAHLDTQQYQEYVKDTIHQ
jgi:hypothetical protein